MPRSGGSYSLFSSSDYPAVADTEIDPDDHNTTLADIAQALTDSVPRDGSGAMTGDLPMGSHKVTGMAAATVAGDAVRYEQVLPSVFTPYYAKLVAIAGLTWADNSVFDLTGTDTIAVVSYATLKASLGLDSTASPQFAGIELGNASDTTIARTAAGIIGVEGVDLVNVSASQTLTNKTLTSPTINGGTSTGGWVVSGETSGILTAASARKKVNCTGDIELDNSVFTAEDWVLFDPGTSDRAFTKGSGVTLYVAGASVTSATLKANRLGLAEFRSAAVAILSGGFL